jgi:hypothetical protein
VVVVRRGHRDFDRDDRFRFRRDRDRDDHFRGDRY